MARQDSASTPCIVDAELVAEEALAELPIVQVLAVEHSEEVAELEAMLSLIHI